MVVDHVTQLGVSRSKEIRYRYVDLYISTNVYMFRIVHIFWIARGYVDEISLHALLRFEIEFQHHLPVVLWIHSLLARMCFHRTTERCCRNSVLDQSRAWKLTPSTQLRVGLGPILTH